MATNKRTTFFDLFSSKKKETVGDLQRKMAKPKDKKNKLKTFQKGFRGSGVRRGR